MRLYLGEPSERRELAYNGCSESAYTGFHPDGHPSESTVCTSHTLTIIREKQLMRLFLEESPERWGLAHNDCSESAYNGYSSESNSIYGSYRDGYSETAYTVTTLTAIPLGVFWKTETHPQ